MPEQSDSLNDFLARIEPHQSFWRSIEFACMTVRTGSEWIQFAGQARLSTDPSEPNSMPKLLVDLDDFRVYAGRFEAKALHALVENLRNSMVMTGMPETPVGLVPGGSRPYSWREPSVWGSSARAERHRKWPMALHVLGTGGDRLLPQEFWRDIDTKLRRHNPPHNGFEGLCAKLDLQYQHTGSSNYFDLCADLPARFVASNVDRKAKSVAFTMEYAGTPELVLEWLPQHQTMMEAVPHGEMDRPGQFEVTIPVPTGATGVEARLLTVEADVDQLSLRVDWENILLHICEFFDPGQTKLADFLFKESNLKGASPFELGVTRLLGLAGYNVLWFGKAAKDALPDLVAYIRDPRGAERIIYGECTLKNPYEKLSDLAKRSDDLRKYLGLKERSILPVVFVRSTTTDQDRQAAIELGLALCNGDNLRKLQENIKCDASPEDIFEFLRALTSLTMIPRGLNSLLS